MKKTLIILLLSFLSINVFAQLRIEEENTQVQKIGTLRSSYSWLIKQGTTYYLVMRCTNQNNMAISSGGGLIELILMPSNMENAVVSKQLLDPKEYHSECIFCLGASSEESILTLNDLIKVANTLDNKASINVKDAKLVNTLIIKRLMVGQPYLRLEMQNTIGPANITVPELNKAYELITEEVNEIQSDTSLIQ